MPPGDGEIQNLAHAYRVLDVPHDASARAIKANYRKLVKRWHPDRYPAGSEAQAEASVMTKLVNATYARIEDAPLRNGFATPLSDKRRSTTSPDPQSQRTELHETPEPDISGASRREYTSRGSTLDDAAFYAILDKARRAGARDDMTRPFDGVGFAVRFVVGACTGSLMGFGGAVRVAMTTPTAFIACVVLGAIGGGLLFALRGMQSSESRWL